MATQMPGDWLPPPPKGVSPPDAARALGDPRGIKYYGPNRAKYLGVWTKCPPHLRGEFPGDYGWDHLNLSSDPETFARYRDAEVQHARWAMLGAAGCLAPEALAQWGVIPKETGIVWWASGVIGPAAADFPYWGSVYTIFFMEVIFMQFAEIRRIQDYRKPGSMGEQYFLGMESMLGGSGDPAYPGGQFFNLFNLGNTPEKLADLKLKEIKNGRLAMVAMFGLGAQAAMTHVGPWQNLTDHINSSGAVNMLTNFSSVQGG